MRPISSECSGTERFSNLLPTPPISDILRLVEANVTTKQTFPCGTIHPDRVRSVGGTGEELSVSGQVQTETYSHSIVAGGLDEMSYTTRLTPLTLFMMSLLTWARKSYGKWNQSAVMASVETTARRATGFS